MFIHSTPKQDARLLESLRKVETSRAIQKEIDQAVQTIINGWEENDTEASQEAQRDQNQEVWFRYMTVQIEAVVGGCVENVLKLSNPN